MIELDIKSKTGRVMHENLDISPINKQKEKFIEYRTYYLNLSTKIAVTIENLDYLINHPQKNSILGKYAPAFQNAIIWNFWAQATIDLCKFFGSNEYSLFKFFNYIRANHNKIFTGIFVNTIYWDDGSVDKETIKYNYDDINSTILECEKIIDHNKDLLIDKIKTFRDKVYAHTEKIDEEVHLCIDDLKKAFNLIDNMVNRLFVFYDRTSYALTPLSSDDVKNICHVIEMYDKYHDIILEEEHKKYNI